MLTSVGSMRTGFGAKRAIQTPVRLDLRKALASYLAQGNKSGVPSFYGLLAELEAMRSDLESALAAIDAGLAIAEETGEHYTDRTFTGSAATSC